MLLHFDFNSVCAVILLTSSAIGRLGNTIANVTPSYCDIIDMQAAVQTCLDDIETCFTEIATSDLPESITLPGSTTTPACDSQPIGFSFGGKYLSIACTAKWRSRADARKICAENHASLPVLSGDDMFDHILSFLRNHHFPQNLTETVASFWMDSLYLSNALISTGLYSNGHLRNSNRWRWPFPFLNSEKTAIAMHTTRTQKNTSGVFNRSPDEARFTIVVCAAPSANCTSSGMCLSVVNTTGALRTREQTRSECQANDVTATLPQLSWFEPFEKVTSFLRDGFFAQNYKKRAIFWTDSTFDSLDQETTQTPIIDGSPFTNWIFDYPKNNEYYSGILVYVSRLQWNQSGISNVKPHKKQKAIVVCSTPSVDIWPIKENDSQYRLTTGRGNWNESRKECLAYGGDLAHTSIRRIEERERISGYVMAKVWIGLNDFQEQGEYRWLDGTVENLSSINWGQGEPNIISENCIFLDLTLLTFHDHTCSNLYHGLCERNN